jgi:GNAT superfamily N-acetyltransferase
MPTGDVRSYQPLDLEACRALSDALGDTPETVISVHLLRRGTCKAYVAGDPSRFDGAIVQANDFPTEPTGFGPDPDILWELLKAVEGWDCILVDSERAPLLGRIIKREMGVGVRYLDDVCHILSRPVATFPHQVVRQLTLSDLELLESAPPELRASCWGSTRALLAEGIVASAIVAGRVVATALTAAISDRCADVGVYTHPDFRRQGLATAAASIVAQRVQESGRTPVWGAGEHNVASLRVARKLGFIEVSRRTYVILDRGGGA